MAAEDSQEGTAEDGTPSRASPAHSVLSGILLPWLAAYLLGQRRVRENIVQAVVGLGQKLWQKIYSALGREMHATGNVVCASRCTSSDMARTCFPLLTSRR